MPSPDLWTDFNTICDFGGRLQGTPGCAAAFEFVAARLGELGEVQHAPTPYHGWTLDELRLATPEGTLLAAMSLIGSAPIADCALEVLDLGRGTPEDVAAAGSAVRGRAVMVRHEYSFAPGAMHRRHKLRAAAEAGAAAILLVQPVPGIGAVSGWANACPIPVVGLGIEAARQLVAAGGCRLLLRARHHPAIVENLVLDLPGSGPERIVLSAHLDGHAPAESAIDNACGVAALLELARSTRRTARGLTICVFGAEEWALSGSRGWLRTLAPDAIAAMTANLNLDSIVGSPNLTALTSGFPALSAQVAPMIAVHEPLQVSSDHASFAAQGVPALRLMAGFGEPDCAVSRLLTAADTRALVAEPELRTVTATAGALLRHLRDLPAGDGARLRANARNAGPAMEMMAALPKV
ncbi:MAG: family peptidase [Rubritepida sp.]|nr:family peptidase [Rubritepida sp.]